MKSELMMLLPPTESTAFHATVASEAQRRGWDSPSLLVKETMLRVVRVYNYLGRKVVDSGGSSTHAKCRAAITAGSVRQFNHIYSSKQIPLRHKTDLCNAMYMISSMMYGHNALPELDVKTDRTYATAYLASWKACVG
eukprot:4440024-Amphidinium_carterae.1